MLSLKAIETYYGTSQVLFGLSLDVQQGEVVTLLGRNGMGKTTTVRSIMGLTPIRAGVITLDGQAIHTLPPYRIARRGLGLVPEGRQISPNLSVREHLAWIVHKPINTHEPLVSSATTARWLSPCCRASRIAPSIACSPSSTRSVLPSPARR